MGDVQDRQTEVVVTGLSGRFPESESVEQFAEQLFAGVDLVTADDRRWTLGLHGLPERFGKLKDLASFDAAFFGVHGKQAHQMDPQLRLLLELTHEAIVDAGLNPAELRGSRTGVYVGVSNFETADMLNHDLDKISGYKATGCWGAMFPNRISYTFDLKGPSLAINTACSSSIYALAQAVAAMRAGYCDAAVVAATNVCLNPVTSLMLHRLTMLSPEGRCAAFDAAGRGFVRAEAAVVMLLQRRGAARRVYATVRGVRTGCDGAKQQGITFPSGEMQRRLAQETFEEAGLKPQDVTYVEAHGTGTKAGDPQEVNAISQLFCSERSTPLLLGSIKSNMGHAEAASGLCSIAKIVVAMERGEIPGNLHFTSPNPEIPALSDGRIQVVAKNTKWDGGLVAVNSFGFGGANAHAILESERGARAAPAQYALPRLVLASGRTDAAARALLAHAAAHARDAELHALMDAVHSRNIPGHAHRGYRLLDGADPPTEEVVEVSGEARPVWFVFPGMGSQCAGAARALLGVPAFAASVARSARALRPLGIDLEHVLTDAPDTTFDDIINSLVSIAAVQVALVDMLREIGVTPDGIVGHSAGELGCAYADGTLTVEQAVLFAYWRGRSVVDAALGPGAMAAVGLGWAQCEQILPHDVVVACHNAPDGVTIAGPVASVEKVVSSLSAKGVFVRRVNSSGIAFHSHYVAAAAPSLRARLETIIPAPKPRSHRWISTSIPKDQWDSDLAKLSDASYHTNNMLSPVWFAEALAEIPARALLVEMAPNAILQGYLRRSLPRAALVPLMRKDAPDAGRHLLAAIGKMYANGAQPQVGKLYPAVSFPVSRGTPGLASWVRWDHSAQWAVARWADGDGGGGGGARAANSLVEVCEGGSVAASGVVQQASNLSDADNDSKERKNKPDQVPKLEKFVFVPYDTTAASAVDAQYSPRDALVASVQLALENSGALRLRVAEASRGAALGELLLPAVLQILASELMVQVDAVLHAGDAPDAYTEPLKHLDVEVTNKDPDAEVHLALARGVLAQGAALAALGGWLAAGGLLLVQEAPGLADRPAAQQALIDAGLILVFRQATNDCEYLLLKNKPSLPAETLVVELDDDHQYLWVDELRKAVKRADNEDIRVYAVARTQDSGVLGLAMCLRFEAKRRALRVFLAPGVREPFDARAGFFAAQAQKDLAVNVLRAGVWGCYRHLPLHDPLTALRQVEHAYVKTLTRDDLSSLRWIESPLRWADEAPQRPNSELCRVYYAPLNFRDVMLATSKLPPDALPGSQAGQKCILGLEFSGRGADHRRVMGIVAAGGLATTVLADKDFLWPVPDAWSLEMAATVPAAYATAYYALSVRGRMRHGESVLVHAGASSVGLAAISVALHDGCTVFTTVGCGEERAFLLERFAALSEDHIGNYCDTSFEQQVAAGTRGRGVDLVLNALAADKLLASTRCLAPSGRFLHIREEDLASNSPLSMAVFLKNTTFHDIQLDALFEAGTGVDRAAVARCIADGIASGAVRPLPATIFANHQLERAFKYTATDKHIGKVLVRVREEEVGGTGRAAPRLVPALPRAYFHPARAHVLVGGLGGVGLALAQWLVERGARALVLVSRRGVCTGYQADRVRQWRKQGVEVVVSCTDCSTPEGARTLLLEAARLAPVSSVFNLAVVTRSALLENLTPEDFRIVCKPKVDVTRALDVATREQCPQLEHFVVFSSMVSGRGNHGLSNYGFANSSMERIVERRQADGLPGLAVQFGAIAEVGIASDMVGNENDIEVCGTLPQSVRSCMTTLGALLSLPHAVVSSVLVPEKSGAQHTGKKPDLVHQVANILGVTEQASGTLADMGLDSLILSEVKQLVEIQYGIVLAATEIRALTFARLRKIQEDCSTHHRPTQDNEKIC